jgi:hypothetical protein
MKMKVLRKKNSPTSRWEDPFMFVKYLDGNGCLE